ncbi:3d66a7d9-b5a8-4162-9903-cb760fc8b09c [Thermothielavioides terrestris]|uniref:3d66a7d9-b5a8-4162-9903-cb760fc8b09c n=1 Tax=Thermothielavioides terrestris TaxID=2587410 RepID=A0A3S4D1J2_9PEZI|nr:3d66a7d9-b5a8-4162-9903-cb760fc8b09c [Thermothielavioides terrestris]
MMRTPLEQRPQRHHVGRGAAGAPGSALPALQNRAGESDSPYVRRHADTPVAWQMLDADTLERAAAENKPIFMHIGFLADHLCHLTTQDSFSNPAVADFLNESFIPILIDREERPDLDAIYQNYSEAVNATGGWPLNLFLTPDLYPIFGGTYWPGPGTEHSAAAAAGGGGASRDESYHDFLAIAKKIHKFWVEQEERCRREAFEMLHKLQDFAQEGTFGGGSGGGSSGAGGEATVASAAAAGAGVSAAADASDLDLDQLDEALARIAKMFDPVDYGFGTPKFPNPARLSFLLRLAHFPAEVREFIGEEEVERATAMATKTLRRIRDGGLRDHLGAGFMRFSVTSDWSMPHFEKMVGENALLLGVFLDAWLGHSRAREGELALDDEFADVVLELADYLTGPAVRAERGGFIASEAADSFYRRGDRHMREGAYYLWTRREFDQVVGGGSTDDHASSVAAAYWNVQEDGNVPQDQDPFDEFINQNVLSVNADATELSKQLGVPPAEIRALVSAAREKLRAHREKERVRPARDEKIVVATNGMVIAALARTAAAVRWLDPERAARYLQAARDSAAFIRENLWHGPESKTNPLRRFFWDRPSQTPAFADDYAFLIDGLLDLYTATFEQQWLDWARHLQDVQTRLFYDSPCPPNSETSSATPAPSPRHAYSGGFYSTEAEALSPTILRLKSGMDKSQPSTNAVAASNLFRLGTLLQHLGGGHQADAYLRQASETVAAFEAEILQYPWLFVSLLTGVVTARLGVREKVVMVGGPGKGKGAEEADEAALRAWYTQPRAEARVLVPLAGDAGAATEGAGEKKEDVLAKEVEGLTISRSSRA